MNYVFTSQLFVMTVYIICKCYYKIQKTPERASAPADFPGSFIALDHFLFKSLFGNYLMNMNWLRWATIYLERHHSMFECVNLVEDGSFGNTSIVVLGFLSSWKKDPIAKQLFTSKRYDALIDVSAVVSGPAWWGVGSPGIIVVTTGIKPSSTHLCRLCRGGAVS